jgi:hypothetical protein
MKKIPRWERLYKLVRVMGQDVAPGLNQLGPSPRALRYTQGKDRIQRDKQAYLYKKSKRKITDEQMAKITAFRNKHGISIERPTNLIRKMRKDKSRPTPAVTLPRVKFLED